MTGARSRAFALYLLRTILAASLLALLWQVADGADAVRRLADANPALLGAAVVVLTLQTGLSALRWRLAAAQLGILIDRRTALREYYLSQIVNQVLPGGVLGDAGRAVRARAQAGLMASGQAVLFDRLAGQIALLAVLCTAFIATRAVPGGLDLPVFPMQPMSLLVLLVCAGAGWVVLRRWLDRSGRLTRFARNFRRALAAPEVRWRQIGLSLGTALCNILAFSLCAAAVGASLSLAAALVLVPLVLLAMVIPVTVAGWGLREGAAVAILPLAGVTAAQSLAASVAFGLVFLVASLPGLAVLGPLPALRATKS